MPFAPRAAAAGGEIGNGGVFVGHRFFIGGEKDLVRLDGAEDLPVLALPRRGGVPEGGEELRRPGKSVRRFRGLYAVRQGEAAEKFFRESEGAGKFVNAPHRFPEIRVLVAGGEEIHTVPKAGIVFFIPRKEDFREDFVLKEIFLIFIREDAEIRVHVEEVEILAQHGLTEGVDGGDGRAAEEGELPLEVRRAAAVFFRRRGLKGAGRAGELLGEGFADAAPHFRRGGTGEGEDEEGIHVRRVGGVGDAADDARHEDGGLAAPGGGGEEEAVPSGGESAFLRGCPFHLAHSDSFPCPSGSDGAPRSFSLTALSLSAAISS